MSTDVVHVPRADVVRSEDFMPLLTIEQAVDRKRQINQFIDKVMREGEDFGTMPGGQTKKVLMKPGAEKLCSIFGLAPRYEGEQIIEDWTGQEHGGEPLFYYRYRCRLYRGERFMGEAVGSANSWEAKYRYRWIAEDQLPASADKDRLVKRGGKRTLFEFIFAFDKRETTGQYGKPEEHWRMFEEALANGTARTATRKTKKGDQSGYEIDVDTTLYRIPNPDASDVVNTCQKMAQKRALVAAVLVVTNCSDAFTQDLEEDQEIVSETEPAKPADKKAPDELARAFAAIDKNPAAFVTACEALTRQIGDKHGSSGIKKYDDLAMKFSEKYPDGCKDKSALKEFVRLAWDVLQQPKADGEQQAITPEVMS